MTDSNFQNRYLEAIGIESGDPERLIKLKAALQSASDLRKFEIELYWKRATYFWAFQAAAFAVSGLIFRDGEPANLRLLIVPGVFGFLTALAGWMTAVGSKFWQDSWEAHVDLLEDLCGARLSKVILLREQPRFSVTGVNRTMLLVLTSAWFAFLIAAIFPEARELLGRLTEVELLAAVVAVLIAALVAFWLGGSSGLTGKRFIQGDIEWRPYRAGRARIPREIVWRRAPGADTL